VNGPLFHDMPWRKDAAVVAAWLRAAPRAPLLQLTARAGFLARAVVYLSVGTLALLAALRLAPTARGATEAMAAWGQWPAGVALIWLTAFGLVGFSLWRGMQAFFDADGHGRDLQGLTVRVGQAISGVAHALLSWSLFSLLDGAEDLHKHGHDAAQDAAARILSLPYGDLLLQVLGAVILGFGIGSVVQGLVQPFAERLGCSPLVCRWIVPLARLGYVGRGLSFMPMGFFLARAGWEARASRAHDFSGGMAALAAQPGGHLVLGAAGVGLFAFGLFAVFEATFRRIAAPSRSS
jgi:Domain of Unknown Function (DUF1206)